MYNVSSVSLQNIYAHSAVEKYSQAGSSAANAEDFYAILAERVKTSVEKMPEYDFDDLLARVDKHTKTDHIIDILTGVGIFKTEEEEEEEKEEEKKAVEVLLKALKSKQKASKEETIDTKKDDRLTVKEVKEVLAGLRCTNRITVS